MRTAKVNETATDCYERRLAEIRTRLVSIETLLAVEEQRTKAGRIDWGHAGDLGHTNALLARVQGSLLGLEPENATDIPAALDSKELR